MGVTVSRGRVWDEEVLGVVGGGDCTTLGMYLMLPNCALKNG